MPNRERLLAELVLPAAPAQPAADRGAGAMYFTVWRADGSVLKAVPPPDGGEPVEPAGPPPYPAPRLTWRGQFREALLAGPHRSRILVGRSARPERAELAAFAWQLAGVGVVVLAVGLAGGWLVSARILRPVAAISATASAISATNLSERIDPRAVDRELAGLAAVLNATFDRLEAAFDRQTRFTADASHELRTPLAIIRSNAELGLARPRTPEEYRESLEACLRAAERMTELVDSLLTLARADAGRLSFQRREVDLKEVVGESVGLFRPVAEKQGVTLSADLEPVRVSGDPLRLGQVVTNLLSNAVRYNRPGGKVAVQLRGGPARARLSVTDTGCGIPEVDRPHIFERFYRVDRARSRAVGGSGLGLAICRSIVEAQGGRIGFESQTGRGSTFWVELPRSGG